MKFASFKDNMYLLVHIAPKEIATLPIIDDKEAMLFMGTFPYR